MEAETCNYYVRAAARTQDASIRQLLDDLAVAVQRARIARAVGIPPVRTIVKPLREYHKRRYPPDPNDDWYQRSPVGFPSFLMTEE